MKINAVLGAITLLLIHLGIVHLAFAEIPYESNDNSYVFIKNTKYSDENDDISFKVLDKVDIRPFSFPSCNGLPIELDDCKKSACISNSAFGKIYHKVNGYDKAGLCQYEQRTPNFGGMDCSIATASFLRMAELIDKSSIFLEKQLVSLDYQENTEFSTMIKKYCKPIEDDTLRSPINIKNNDIDDYSSEKIDNLSFFKQSHLKKGEDSHNEPGTHDSGTLALSKSIMFTKDELEVIARFYENFKSQDSGLRLKQLSSSSKNYYLNSIIFLDDNKWIIWVNGQKITKDERIPDLDIVSTTKEKCILKFTVKNVSTSMPLWKGKFLTDNPRFYSNKNETVELAIDDEDIATILVSIKPNQHFELYELRVNEGE